MGSFQYEALRMGDKVRIQGVINANNEREARELLREQELMTLKLLPLLGSKQKGTSWNPINYIFKGISASDKIAFTRNLSMMVKAGVPVTESLLYFETYSDSARMKSLAGKVRKDILSGQSLSNALKKQQGFFDDIFIGIIQAGESSGELDATLKRLTDLMVRSQKLKSKVVTASVYPAIVVGILGIVLLIMFLFVLPTFEKIYKDMNVQLPFITQFMLAISHGLRGYWFLSFPALFGSCFGIFKYLSSAGGKLLLDQWLLKVPILGRLLIYINISYYISTLAVAFGSGVSITEALELAYQTVSNFPIKQSLKRVSPKVQSGSRLGAALEAVPYIPQLVMLMISTGEESGELEKMLEASFEYLEEEVSQTVDRLTTMIEPVMLLVLGVIVGAVALSIYLPLFSIYEHL